MLFANYQDFGKKKIGMPMFWHVHILVANQAGSKVRRTNIKQANTQASSVLGWTD